MHRPYISARSGLEAGSIAGDRLQWARQLQALRAGQMAFYLRYYNMLKKMNKGLLGLALTMGITSVQAAEPKHVDVLLIGGGIMSATLGVWLNELEPGMSMEMIERLDGVALESSNGWNNAGTGHSALAELNYTPEDKNGNVEIPKAIEINEAFQVSRQFWSWQVKNGVLKDPRSFINSTPHMSFVWGDDNIKFLKKRYEALQASPLFAGMQYSEDPVQIKKWVPLMMEGRDPNQKVAATWSPIGTDVNFGEITRQFAAYLQTKPNFSLKLSSEVQDIKRNEDGSWRVVYKNLKDGSTTETDAKFVFIGAGGGALHLLQKSGIPEAKEYAGFPVGGSFLVTENPTVAEQHLAKAYGKASVGAPPMSVPHLDTRVALQEYFPNAKKEDWRLWQAGQRVQIIKRDEDKGGVLKLGTEIVSAKDGSIAGLLGASPGASTAAPIMLTVLETVFKDKVATPEWQAKLHQIVPSYGTKLNGDPDRVAQEWAYTAEVLKLTPPPAIPAATHTATPAQAPAKPAPSNPAADMAL